MKFKAILLYALGALLLLLGNRDLWDELQEERANKQHQDKLAAAAKTASEQPFEVQQLQQDTVTGAWKNPNVYFQLVNVSYVNFKAIKKSSKTKIETDDDEDASDSN